ncbi:MAG: hypothetical protein ABRQ26_13190 [Syntrophomonadaceae bacterium]|jgi:hypothetical protein
MIAALNPNEVAALLKVVTRIQFLAAIICTDSLNGLSASEKDLHNLAFCSERLSHTINNIIDR